INTIFPDLADGEKNAVAAQKQRDVAELHGNLKAADCVILTLGNVVDFFRDDGSDGTPLMENIFPKFIAMPGSEDINVRSASAANLKGKGAVLRLANYSETLEAIQTCIRGIRSVTNATLVVTISPVPIDSVIGLVTHHLKSAIEVDCVSKSRLRSAFDDVFAAERRTDAAIWYFPSFEIVRWIAPLLPIPAFGLDDAASRHVSSPILNGICSLFTQKFITFSDEPDGRLDAAGLALERNA
ncbi:MAG: GSCFA domain-containing protein, partial [Pseudorhodoplanes sp.]|nr:GSCFA domain-containing protein [Pseudorhodoplanes sp.]